MTINFRTFRFAVLLLFSLGGGTFCGSALSATRADEALHEPVVTVQAVYPGASCKVVAELIAAPLEEQIRGVEQMRYMQSQSGNDGTYVLNVVFKPGVDLKKALARAQKRVNLAVRLLPEEVRRSGVTVKQRPLFPLLFVKIFSSDSSRDTLYLSNYASIQLKDELARVRGVGSVVFFGQRDYRMSIWLDPDRLSSRNLTADDVVKVLREQNAQVAAGQIGQQPVPHGQSFQYTMTTLGR